MRKDYQLDDQEPEKKEFPKPSEKEHLLQVIDIYDYTSEIGQKLNLDENTVSAKLEVIGGEEEGRTMLCRLSLNDQDKGFFFTRLFLKATGQDYKGKITIDTDFWCGLRMYATVKHNGDYANIKEYNFDKKIEQVKKAVHNPDGVINPEDIAWEP